MTITEVTTHMDDLLHCPGCDEDRERWRFASNKAKTNGRNTYCRDCTAEQDAKRRATRKKKQSFRFGYFEGEF